MYQLKHCCIILKLCHHISRVYCFREHLFKHHSGIENQWKSGWDTLCLFVLAKHTDAKVDVLLVFQHHSWTSYRADLQRQRALQRLHLRHLRGVGRRGGTPATGPSEAGGRGAGRGRGGDEVAAAAAAAVAPRPGPAVQPGSRPSSC